ncbi:acetylxylan esterase [Pseudonocardia sichuanensis]
MALSDLSLDELVRYRPSVREPVDFDDFWSKTLAEARTHDLDVEAEEVDTPYRTTTVRDVSFRGFGGDRVGAWFTVPRGVDGPLPAVVEFIGYNGGRDLPGESLRWASAGYAHLLVDTRGQGARWGGGGRTGDPHGSGPSTPGFMTRGIEHPDTYFYRRVFTDAVRAVEAVRTLPGVDPAQVAVQGISQGGGITLAVAGLVPDLVAVMPDVPFLCHFARALDICDKDPFAEITRYLAVHRPRVDDVLHTLSYVDGVNFAKRATAPSLFSVALMDLVCPPSTVYAAYNHYGSNHYAGERPDVRKDIEVYRFNDHEGGESYQRQAQIRWLNGVLGRP